MVYNCQYAQLQIIQRILISENTNVNRVRVKYLQKALNFFLKERGLYLKNTQLKLTPHLPK